LLSKEDLQRRLGGNDPSDSSAAHLNYRVQHGMRTGGFGILFARELADEVVQNNRDDELISIKYLGDQAPGRLRSTNSVCSDRVVEAGRPVGSTSKWKG
jgi:hypothetical protein